MISHQDFNLLVQDVLAKVNERLEKRRAGMHGVGTIAELDSMIRELTKLEKSVNENNLPPSEQRYLRAAYFVIDAWPPDDRLGKQICEVDYCFRHMLE
jgi:hypothetical protein